MKHAPIPDFADMAEAIAWCHAEIDRFRAEPVTPPVPKPLFYPKGATEAARICLNCRGYGFTHEDHGYDHTMGTVRCRRCAGKGYLA